MAKELATHCQAGHEFSLENTYYRIWEGRRVRVCRKCNSVRVARYIERHPEKKKGKPKTANIWIRAWENRDSELAVNDWDAYMRVLYGNVPKKLKAPKPEPSEENDDDRDDHEQHGGEGFQEFFPDKGKPGFLGFKTLVATLQRDFFGSKSYTLEAKQQFITELINWLENTRKNLRS